MANIKVTNRFLRFNLIVALIMVISIKFIFRDKKFPIRCIKKFPIHLPH